MDTVSQVSWVDNSPEIKIDNVLAIDRVTKALPLNLYQHVLTLAQEDISKIEIPRTDYIPMELVFDGLLDQEAIDSINKIIAYKYKLSYPSSNTSSSSPLRQYSSSSSNNGDIVNSIWYFEDNFTTVIPIQGNDPLYMLAEDSIWVELRECLDYKILMSHRFLTTSKLPLFVSESVILCSDVIMIPRADNRLLEDDIMEDTRAMENDGAMSIWVNNRHEIDLIKELALLWPIEILISSPTMKSEDIKNEGAEGYILVRLNGDLGLPLTSWIRETINDAKEGKMPAVYYYPAKDEKYQHDKAVLIYDSILGSERGREINEIIDVTGLPYVKLRLPSYKDVTSWRDQLNKPITAKVVISDVPEIPGELFISEEGYLEIELPDRYITTNFQPTSLEEATKWWRSGQGLSPYALGVFIKTGQISTLVD